ncbi:hypothetical protein SeLEV6574_g01712 [Synchytrium endobioticum]|nr:hypothetical protein SeLEV6574_g01712 [Synchytrium endobioticum]
MTDYLAVGRYQVANRVYNDGLREGGVTILSYDKQECTLNVVAAVETSGTLDVKWISLATDDEWDAPQQSFLVADATGGIQLYRFKPFEIQKRIHHQVASANALILMLYIAPTFSTKRVYSSVSDGRISVLDLTNDLIPIWSTKAHEYEAWCVSGDGENLVYSGGDDAMLYGWDLRSGSSTFRNKSHLMGVTYILPHPSQTHPHILMTGSYDEYLRIFDVRKPSTPLYEEVLLEGGGVWKLKPNKLENDTYRVLAACMHAGVTVFDVDSDLNVIKGDQVYKGHKSFVYGVDWYGDEGGVSCAFEDNSVHVWTLDREE